MELKQILAAWIKHARTEAGLSGSDLGAKLALALDETRGYTRANISHWETMKHEPSLEQILAIAKITKRSLPNEIISAMTFGDVTITNDHSLGTVKVHQDSISIQQYKGVGGAMGHGIVLKDQPGEIEAWNVTPEWIAKNVRNHTGVANLCIVTGFGNSMQPLYNPGDPLIVDRGVTSVDADATYFFRVGNEGFIKLLQRIPGEGIRVISKNKDFETWTIKPEMDFEILGQVLKAWCGTDV